MEYRTQDFLCRVTIKDLAAHASERHDYYSAHQKLTRSIVIVGCELLIVADSALLETSKVAKNGPSDSF